jgi:hypothetical protein
MFVHSNSHHQHKPAAHMSQLISVFRGFLRPLMALSATGAISELAKILT